MRRAVVKVVNNNSRLRYASTLVKLEGRERRRPFRIFADDAKKIKKRDPKDQSKGKIREDKPKVEKPIPNERRENLDSLQ